MEQKRLSPGPLLNADGNLSESGYATELVKEYSRSAIKASGWRIKEWDYYYVADDSFGVALTIADNSYMSLVSASLMDFNQRTFVTDSEIKPFSFGKLKLPSTSQSGDVTYKSGRVFMTFINDGKQRRLVCSFDKWGKEKKKFECEFVLTGAEESMVIATPFHKPRHFYYNQKINCMDAVGFFSVSGDKHEIKGMGTLDWGRGVWTYENTWYWGSLSTLLPDGHKFGFNIGYGFGDTSAATENMLFYDGKAHKLDGVLFDIPRDADGRDDFMQEWRFTSSFGRFEMRFEPVIDRKDYTSAIVIASDQHQVFGKFYGRAILDDGQTVELDGQLGFAEKVRNKW